MEAVNVHGRKSWVGAVDVFSSSGAGCFSGRQQADGGGSAHLILPDKEKTKRLDQSAEHNEEQ